MKRMLLMVLTLGLPVLAGAAVFERYLSADRPADRAILNYLDLERSGTASSKDLAELGVLLLDKGFPNDAEQYLRRSLKLDKHNFEAAYRLALVLQREGHELRAMHYYRRVLKDRPGYSPARFMLALCEERLGRRDAAIRDYAKAYRYSPDLSIPEKNPLVYDSRLQVEAQLRRYREEVAATTLKAAPLDPAEVQRMMSAQPRSVSAPAQAGAPAGAGGAQLVQPRPAVPVITGTPAATGPRVADPVPPKPVAAPTATPTPRPGPRIG